MIQISPYPRISKSYYVVFACHSLRVHLCVLDCVISCSISTLCLYISCGGAGICNEFIYINDNGQFR